MKRLVQSVVAVAAVCLLAGCETTGLSPRETSTVGYPNYILGLPSGVAGAPQKIVAPIRLAVAQVGEDAPPETMLNQLAAQKKFIASVAGLPLPGENPSYYGSAEQTEPDYASRVKTVCDLAQNVGADYLFILGGSLDSWRENNSLSALDATLVGGAIFPGTKIHVEGRGAGALISVTTRRPVMFVTADSHTSAMSPDYFVEGKTAALNAQVRDQLASKLADQFLNQLATCAVH